MSIYYQDASVALHLGDSLDVARTMPDQSVDCIVTSPPYFGLRDYGNDGQYGTETSPAEYVETMRALFAELRRVLADDGTLWLNLGDSHSGMRGNHHPAPDSKNSHATTDTPPRFEGKGKARKNLLGMPWRVAFALQDDGWILRNDIIWSKPNAMPESVTDRLSTRHEHVFMFSKSQRYWFDLDPIRVPHAGPAHAPGNRASVTAVQIRGQHEASKGLSGHYAEPDRVWQAAGGRNPGDVWEIPTQPFPGAHFAVFPLALPERCILAGCKPGGTVLDPFSGSGTTGMAAAKHGRKYVGIDLNAEYHDLALRTRLLEPSLDFGGVS